MRRLLPVGMLVWVGCTASEGGQKVGSFEVSWTATPPGLVVKASDGRELVRTAAPFVDVRSATPTWEMQFGSFKVEDDASPWYAGKTMTATSTDAAGLAFEIADDNGGKTKVVLEEKPAGVLQLSIDAPAAENRVRVHFTCDAKDHFLGFGGQADAVDHRGHKLPMWMSEPGIGKTDLDEVAEGDELWFLTGTRHASSYPLPTFLSNRGFAFLADTTRNGTFDLCQAKAGEWSVETWDHQVTLKLYDGPAPAKSIEKLTADIGRQPLATDLAFAVWNDAIFGSDTVRDIAKLLRDHDIPSSAIWTEDFRGGAYDGTGSYRLREEWDVDRQLYPDVEALAAELHAGGFRWFAYHNTFLVSGTDIYEEARTKGLMIKNPFGNDYLFTGVTFVPTSLVDLSNPEGVKLVVDKLKNLIRVGFDGWMADYGEWLPADALITNGNAEEVHNEYPRAYDQAVTEAMKAADPKTSTFFVRSGSLRTAPYQPVVWGGDQFTSFDPTDGLPTMITLGLNLGLGGVSTYGSDIAGYQNATQPPSTKETFFRWASAGALTPVMRTHHGTKAKENWWFGKDEETIAHWKRWAKLHQALWPYFRAGAQEAFDHGLPIMRQLALAFPADEKVWTIKDEYLLGPSLLVAPVLVEGATSRPVYFPVGRWMPWFSGESVQGGETRTVEMPLTEAGIWARPGTIVPLLPDDVDTLMPADPPVVDLDDARDQRQLVVFAGASGTWTDVDGTKYVLTSSSNDAPTRVRVNGTIGSACTIGPEGCLTLEPAKRVATITGAGLITLEFLAGDKSVAKLEVTGAAKVKSVTLRW